MRTILLLMAAALLGLTGTPASAGTLQLLGVWEEDLVAGLAFTNEEFNCDNFDRCENLQNISVLDIPVGAAVDAALPGSQIGFTLEDDAHDLESHFSRWMLCQYDDRGYKIRCDESGGGFVYGPVSRDTETVRVLLDLGVDRPFRLVIYAR